MTDSPTPPEIAPALTVGMASHETTIAALIERLWPEARLRIAAICLYGQPFGFTWAEVDAITHVAEYGDVATWRTNDAGEMVPFHAAIESAARKLRALLPPKSLP